MQVDMGQLKHRLMLLPEPACRPCKAARVTAGWGHLCRGLVRLRGVGIRVVELVLRDLGQGGLLLGIPFVGVRGDGVGRRCWGGVWLSLRALAVAPELITQALWAGGEGGRGGLCSVGQGHEQGAFPHDPVVHVAGLAQHALEAPACTGSLSSML